MGEKKRVLVVDDEPDIRGLIGEILSDEGYDVTLAGSGAEANSALAQMTPDLVLLDVWMPDIDGISLLAQWRARDHSLRFPVVMISGHGTVETAVEATRLGAVDFVEKPVSLSRLLATLEKAFSRWVPALAATPPAPLVGNSESMRTLRADIERFAALQDTVLVVGASGSGKTLVARHLHQNSPRSKGPFVVCRAESLDDDNAAIELLGVEHDQHWTPGLLAQAQGGVLLLSDLHELGLQAQRILLTTLERGQYRAVGGQRSHPLDLRIIASSVDDEALALQLDPVLYERLSAIILRTCALDARREDIPALVTHFVDQLTELEQLSYRSFDVGAKNRLRHQSWPGGVRELRNMVKRLLLLSESEHIDAAEVGRFLVQRVPDITGTQFDLPVELPLREARAAFERAYLLAQLRDVGGRMNELAAKVGMERTHLYRKLRALDIDPKQINDES